MFRFDSAERADREAAAGVCLQVFDVGSGSEARCFERLHRAVAMFAAHELGWGTRSLMGGGERATAHADAGLSAAVEMTESSGGGGERRCGRLRFPTHARRAGARMNGPLRRLG